MDRTKPIVHYRNNGHQRIAVGMPAVVYPIDHYNKENVSNTGPVITSPVIELGAHGEFETRNTIYRPDKVMTLD